MIFKRKIYDELLQWKRTDEGRTAVLIQGARRVGKSTVAEEFATNEYDTHILVDFAASIYWWILPHVPLKSETYSMMYPTLTVFSCGCNWNTV